MNFRTISDLNNLIINNLARIPDNIDLIVGVPRSGMVPAYFIALNLNLPCVDVNALLNNQKIECGNTKRRDNWVKYCSEAKNILIVEDSINSGKSILEVKNRLKEVDYNQNITYMAVYASEKSCEMVDIYLEKLAQPRMFEWNYMHHGLLKYACFDIDGVLCEDPTEEQNDDGERYIEFIRNAKVRFKPTYKIGTLVTCRLEKYRAETEMWLKKNEIEYDKLIMMNLKTKEERIACGNHGQFKGEIYKSIKDAVIFVESDFSQAKIIADKSRKLVYCVENQTVLDENLINRLKQISKRKIRNIFKHSFTTRLLQLLRKKI